MSENDRSQVMDEAEVRKEIGRMAREIVAQNGGTDALVLLGIRRRGAHIAAYLQEEIQRTSGVSVPLGTIDITLYRDDLGTVGPRPVIGETELPQGGIDDQVIVIVDDVAYTGRTVRAALNEISDWGRPKRVLLCVLMDRGGRELPIQPDITGRNIEVHVPDRVEVSVPEIEGHLGVDLVRGSAETA